LTFCISQGATYLKCDGKCYINDVASFWLSSAVKECLKSPNVCQSYERMYAGMFVDSQCMYELLFLFVCCLFVYSISERCSVAARSCGVFDDGVPRSLRILVNLSIKCWTQVKRNIANCIARYLTIKH